MPKEIANISTVVPKKTKSRKGVSIGYDKEARWAYRQVPLPRAIVERLIEELQQFSHRTDVKHMSEFYFGKGMASRTYYDLLEKHPDLKEAHNDAKKRLGVSLWGRSCDFKHNWTAVKFLIHEYGDEFAKAKAMEKEQSANQQGIVVVQIPEIITKKKKKNEEDL